MRLLFDFQTYVKAEKTQNKGNKLQSDLYNAAVTLT